MRERYNRRGRRRLVDAWSAATCRVAPSNIGAKTMPDYEALANQAIRSLRGGGRVFAGQRDDPFFIPLDRVFDSINLEGAGTGNMGGGIDTLAGYGVQSVVLQVPEAQVTRDGRLGRRPDGRQRRRRRLGVDRAPAPAGDQRRQRARRAERRSDWVQVSRLGNPLDQRAGHPARAEGQVQPHAAVRTTWRTSASTRSKPFPAAALNQLFDLGIKETDRTDIVQALLTGIPGVTQIGNNPAPADTLKINLGVPPSATENRFGVIGGDNAGFPNGRRLADDVVDITLRVVGGYLVPAAQGGKKLPLGDGVDRNDQAFLGDVPVRAVAEERDRRVADRGSPGAGARPDARRGSRASAGCSGRGRSSAEDPPATGAAAPGRPCAPLA